MQETRNEYAPVFSTEPIAAEKLPEPAPNTAISPTAESQSCGLLFNFEITEKPWWIPTNPASVTKLENEFCQLKDIILRHITIPDHKQILQNYEDIHHLNYLKESLVGERNLRIGTTLDDIEILLNDETGSRYGLKVQNFKKAVEHLFDKTFETKLGFDTFTPEFLKEIHSIVGVNLMRVVGNYRTDRASPSDFSHYYLEPKLISNAMTELCKLVREELGKPNSQSIVTRVKIAAAFMTNFLHIHPFENANGRVARLAVSLLLSDLSLVPVPLYSVTDSRYAYIASLIQSRNQRSNDETSPFKPSDLARLIFESVIYAHRNVCSILQLPDPTELPAPVYLIFDFEYPERFEVPEWKMSWDKSYCLYNPPYFTAKPVLENKVWADRELEAKDKNPPKWNTLDGNVNRQSHTGFYELDEDGFPLNPTGRTGLRGRGVLGKWGPNHSANPIVTRWKCDGTKTIPKKARILQFIGIQRGDTGEWAIPGGMVADGFGVANTLRKLFIEEIFDIDASTKEDAKKLMSCLKELLRNNDHIYKGYMGDQRNTDNAWMETDAVNFHADEETETEKILSKFPLKAGSTSKNPTWIDISSSLPLYGSHKIIIERLVKNKGANWQTE